MPTKKTLVLIYIGLFAIVTICPPWRYVANIPGAGIVYKPAGYGFIFAPPPPEHEGNAFFGIGIDFMSLFLHWVALSILYFVFALLLFKESARYKTVAEAEAEEDEKLLVKYGHLPRIPKDKQS